MIYYIHTYKHVKIANLDYYIYIYIYTYIQWILSISNTLYLELLSISNNFLGPLDISIDSSLIFSLYLEPPYLELLSVSNKNFGPMQIFLSLSRTFQPSHSL